MPDKNPQPANGRTLTFPAFKIGTVVYGRESFVQRIRQNVR